MKPANIVRYLAAALVGAIAASVVLASAISATLHYPDSWAQVSFAQPRDEVLRRNPGAMTEAWDIKGDFWEASCLIGRWQMQVGYDAQQKVASKQLVLYIGIRDTFKAFYFL